MRRYHFDERLAMEWVEKIGLAVIILLITWLLARAAKWAFAKLVDNVAFFRRGTASGATLGETLGTIVSLFIWLFGLVAVLSIFGLGGVMTPIQGMLNSALEFIPRLIGAGLIFYIGLKIAGIVRDLVTTSAQTVNLDKWASRGGVENVTGNSAISRTLGTIVYVLIIIPVAILALDTLDLESVSRPASDMLHLILAAIPRIIGAAILLGIGYVISRFVVQILKELLPGLGVDRAIAEMDVLPPTTAASTVIARVVQITIILFFAIAATRLLGFPELTAILDEVLELGGRVVFGAVVILIGFLIANLLARVIAGTGEGEKGNMPAAIVRWATIILFTFMGLQFMGVGEDIVRLAFGALVIGGAAAAALAFGLGGRDAAARVLENVRQNPPKAPPPPAKTPRGGASATAGTATTAPTTAPTTPMAESIEAAEVRRVEGSPVAPSDMPPPMTGPEGGDFQR